MVRDLVYPEGIYLDEIIAYYSKTWEYLRPYMQGRPFFVKFSRVCQLIAKNGLKKPANP
ncbi:hypothetical protein [Carboxydothermus ferrireducens]|uniref:Dissimilatory sulfite reductase (Desulfoviridin) alpha/beta subunit n=1 Tax=Carboxydothermus ferrireducens DSM 11255 TaxID=1119529 RepID=A0ABX2RBJ8_9THEO|nr:hypothetical protein [Carboxydothermus ferrireducens]NYE58547.1 dissimilatory sulfite reductase (desulfoviridin) alpha/beta subunit [Carboxydothermus ferrireducens DSM 11255]